MSKRLDTHGLMVLVGIDQAFTEATRSEDPMDVIPCHVPGFIVPANPDAFVPGRLVEAIARVITLGEQFDWRGTSAEENPISVALSDLRGIVALFPISAKSYQAEGLGNLLAGVLQGIKDTLEEHDIRRSTTTVIWKRAFRSWCSDLAAICPNFGRVCGKSSNESESSLISSNRTISRRSSRSSTTWWSILDT